MKHILVCVVILFATTYLLAQESSSNLTYEELDSLYHLKYEEKNYPEALDYALTLLKNGKKELNTEDTSYAKILLKVGISYRRTNNFPDAITYLEKAIDIQKIKSPKHADLASSLYNLGATYYYQNKLKEAEEAWLQTIKVQKEALGLLNPKYAKTLNLLGILYYKRGDYQNVEKYFLQTLNIRKKTLGEKHPDYASSLNNLGVVYKNMENYAKAEEFYLQALSTRKEILGEKHPHYAASLNNLGNLYSNISNIADYAKAEKFYFQALKIRKEILGEEHSDYGRTLNNLGALYYAEKAYTKAEKVYIQALNIQKETLGEKDPSYTASLNNLGALYKVMGEYTKSEKFYLQALSIRKKVLGERHLDYIASLNNLGFLYQASKKTELAWKFGRSAIEVNSNLKLDDKITQAFVDHLFQANCLSPKEEVRTLILFYDLLADKKNTATNKQQLLVSDLAIKLLERSKNELTEQEDKLTILEERSQWVLNYIKVLDKEKEAHKALNIVEENKSVLLLDAASNKKAYSFGFLPDSLIQREIKLQKQYTNTKAALVKTLNTVEQDSIRTNLTNLSLEIDVFQKEVNTNYPKYAALKYKHQAIKAKEIQKLLDNQTAFLEYLIGDSVVYIFYVDKQEVKVHEFAISNQKLKDRIKTLQSALSNYELIFKNKKLAYKKYTEHAHWFYKHLVAPVLTDHKHIKQLLIVTDGELGHLPFEAFLVESVSQKEKDYHQLHYLINDYAISYNYSATLWRDNIKSPNKKNNGQILGMAANYGIQLDSSKPEIRLPAEKRQRGILNTLPNAKKEVEALEKNFSGFFAFDMQASEKAFKEKSTNFAIIHLAMHGFLNHKEPILSSLIFTENSDSTENNFLHAYEISKMNINADLVVLSACETGYGKFERGNGIASLARAFMYAGAPAMIVSLWQVNDYTTSQIMKNLYSNLSNRLKKDVALQNAKLAYIKTAKDISAHPAFWSPFILMGDSKAIDLKIKGSPYFTYAAIGLLLALGGLFLLKKKKLNIHSCS